MNRCNTSLLATLLAKHRNRLCGCILNAYSSCVLCIGQVFLLGLILSRDSRHTKLILPFIPFRFRSFPYAYQSAKCVCINCMYVCIVYCKNNVHIESFLNYKTLPSLSAWSESTVTRSLSTKNSVVSLKISVYCSTLSKASRILRPMHWINSCSSLSSESTNCNCGPDPTATSSRFPFIRGCEKVSKYLSVTILSIESIVS